LLLSRFNEFKGSLDIENIEEDFSYSKDYVGLSKSYKEKVITQEFENSKTLQTENIQRQISSLQGEEILVFTDGSTLGNPGPTGAGAVVYLEGYNTTPILLKRSVSSFSNNYAGEVEAIDLALNFLHITEVHDKEIHMYTDCQAAIQSVFSTQTPKTKIATIQNAQRLRKELHDRNNSLTVHWIPGHMNITGNDLADRQAKEAAKEAVDVVSHDRVDGRSANLMLHERAIEKWKVQYQVSETTEVVKEVIAKAGDRKCVGEKHRATYSKINQLISGHTKLKNHWAKVTNSHDRDCNHCSVPETINHFLFECRKFTDARKKLENKVEEILHRHNIPCGDITVGVLTGEIENITTAAKEELIENIEEYIGATKRL